MVDMMASAAAAAVAGGGSEWGSGTTPLTSNAKAWQSIRIAHGIRCVADRSWKFFTPLYLSKSCGSIRPTAAIALAENLAVATLSTAAATYYEKEQNTVAITLVENASVILGGLMLFLYVMRSSPSQVQGQISPLRSPFFLLVMVCSCVDSVCSTLLGNAISKEWVAALFHTTTHDEQRNEVEGKRSTTSLSSQQLASANARMSQIDLLVATICPLLVSFLIQQGGGNYKRVMWLLLGQHAIGTSIVVYNMKRAMWWQPKLQRANKKENREKETLAVAVPDKGEEVGSNQSDGKLNLNPLAVVFGDDAIPTKTKLITLSYMLLYCTVLSPSSILNAWLNSIRQKVATIDIQEATIALFGSGAQLFGALATFLSPAFIQRLGKYKAGIVLQYFQSACIVTALISFYRILSSSSSSSTGSGINNSNANIWLLFGFLLPIAMSRVGLWGFDLAERQILQETIPRNKQTVYFNAERSLTQFASLVMTYLCYVVSDPESFGVLVNISGGAVMIASVILGWSYFGSFGGDGST